MIDKEKQIEEIARIIHFDYWGACGADNCSDCSHSVLNICNDKIIAEKLYNKLFPECSVVLSKEEFETLVKTAQGEIGKMKTTEFIKACLLSGVAVEAVSEEEQLQKARKETAMGILKLVDKKLDLYQNGVIGGSLYDVGYKSAVQEIKFSIKKQFGVEVEE